MWRNARLPSPLMQRLQYGRFLRQPTSHILPTWNFKLRWQCCVHNRVTLFHCWERSLSRWNMMARNTPCSGERLEGGILGRNWMGQLWLKWRELVRRWWSLYEKVVVTLKTGMKPWFMRARSIPYAPRESIKHGLEWQVSAGVLKPVKSSTWATPILVVLKANGAIRICGDYKVTLNPCLEE